MTTAHDKIVAACEALEECVATLREAAESSDTSRSLLERIEDHLFFIGSEVQDILDTITDRMIDEDDDEEDE